MSDYRGFRITEIHAITDVGDDDEESIPAWFAATGPIPLIPADPKRLEDIKAMAQRIADATAQSFKITQFSVREDIGEIKSTKTN
ncbi:hypothetical protein V1294_003892 [Bradyrhizobium sp. AZCC 1678]|uniref:hypothetical protein n=1 Tax=Bradyrhizobium sp. AZCC 1678 TaxID=3117030 RepID=UPI002FF0D256